jgi:hypothetical protein
MAKSIVLNKTQLERVFLRGVCNTGEDGMRQEDKDVMISVRVPLEVVEKIDQAVAQENGKGRRFGSPVSTRSDVVRAWIADGLEKIGMRID